LNFINLNLQSLRSVICVKRGGPSGLTKRRSRSLKVSLLLFCFWLCATQETTSYKLVVRCCYHFFFGGFFSWVQCSFAKKRTTMPSTLLSLCSSQVKRRRTRRRTMTTPSTSFFFLLPCSLRPHIYHYDMFPILLRVCFQLEHFCNTCHPTFVICGILFSFCIVLCQWL